VRSREGIVYEGIAATILCRTIDTAIDTRGRRRLHKRRSWRKSSHYGRPVHDGATLAIPAVVPLTLTAADLEDATANEAEAEPLAVSEIMVPDLLACLTGGALSVLVNPLVSDAEQDRRRAPRIPVSELNSAMRLTMPGTGDLALVNVSESGALIETGRYLRLGGMADVFVRLEHQRHTLRARIVRVHLQAITSAGARYHAALQFETRFPFPV
jgi:hypothetical protein